jgi:YHS domain-containing protein
MDRLGTVSHLVRAPPAHLSRPVSWRPRRFARELCRHEPHDGCGEANDEGSLKSRQISGRVLRIRLNFGQLPQALSARGCPKLGITGCISKKLRARYEYCFLLASCGGWEGIYYGNNRGSVPHSSNTNGNIWERRYTMARDPVCGMNVNEQQAAGKSEYQGQTYYFCSSNCKQQFDQNPQRYASEGTPQH